MTGPKPVVLPITPRGSGGVVAGLVATSGKFSMSFGVDEEESTKFAADERIISVAFGFSRFFARKMDAGELLATKFASENRFSGLELGFGLLRRHLHR